jgi:uncharacterized membrane protein YqjE
MTAQRRERAWVGDLKVALIVLVGILLSSAVAGGTARIVVMFATVVVLALLVRAGGAGWRFTRSRQRRHSA